jgi:hypothetical protein
VIRHYLPNKAKTCYSTFFSLFRVTKHSPDRGLGDREAVDLETVHGGDADVLNEVSALVLHHD